MYGFVCLFLLLSSHAVFCIFFVNACVVSVLGFGVKVLFTHVALFSPWSVPILSHLCHTAIVFVYRTKAKNVVILCECICKIISTPWSRLV